MANIQHIADRIFRHVDAGRLPVGYALAMGALIDHYDDNPDVHEWVDAVSGSAVEKLIARMVRHGGCTRHGAWNDPAWLRETIAEDLKREARHEPHA